MGIIENYLKVRKIKKNNGHFEKEYYYELRDLQFCNRLQILEFSYHEITIKPKIKEYRQVNKVKYPIYEQTTSSKRILKYKKTIMNLKKFLNYELFNLFEKYSLELEHIKQICDILGDKPKWYVSLIEIGLLNDKLRNYDQEKARLPEEWQLLKTNYKTKKCNLWLRLFLAPFTLFISLMTYRSEKKNLSNEEKNRNNQKKNDEWINQINYSNEKLKEQIDLHNKKINTEINKHSKVIYMCQNKTLLDDQKEFINIKDIFDGNYDFSKIKDAKGVYIIWNKTKNKYYVGQTKNIYKRLFTQHFDLKNETFGNRIFAEDWLNNDEFFVKYEIVNSKDELDDLEREYIGIYDSFKSGYNKTSGNL